MFNSAFFYVGCAFYMFVFFNYVLKHLPSALPETTPPLHSLLEELLQESLIF